MSPSAVHQFFIAAMHQTVFRTFNILSLFLPGRVLCCTILAEHLASSCFRFCSLKAAMALKHFRRLSVIIGDNYQSKRLCGLVRTTLVPLKTYSASAGGEDPQTGRGACRNPVKTEGGGRGRSGSRGTSFRCSPFAS